MRLASAALCASLVASTAAAEPNTDALEQSSASLPAADENGSYGYAIDIARPELHTSVSGHGDFGVGFRLDLPIVPWGLLADRHDEFAISPGIDFQFVDFDRRDHVLLMPQLALQWNFYFPRGWSVFPELGAVVVIGDVGDDYEPNHHLGSIGSSTTSLDFLAAFGARRHFNARTALLLRGGWPNGFQLGVTI
jgi:hypothetical protein